MISMIRLSSPRPVRLALVLGSLLVLMSGAAPRVHAQQADPLQRAKALYQKAQTAYEAEENETAIDHLEQIEELLADRSGPAVDTLRARRLALLSRAQYRTGALGGAQRAHIKMMNTEAVPPALADEMADHRKRVEVALMEEVPKVVRSSIRTAATTDTLDLSGRDLIGLPDSVGRLTPRKRVDLSRNDLPSLPRGIGRWTEVQELDVSNNRLGCVPESIGQLSRLEELDLSYNRLTELPSSIGQLTNLRRLNLEGNEVKELPASIDQLTLLNILNLSSPRQARRLWDLLPESANLVYPTELPGTRWIGTAKVRIPLRSPTPGSYVPDSHRALLDTLTNVLARRDTVMTVRVRQTGPIIPRVVDSVSVGLSSGKLHTEVTHVRVDYVFGITGEFEEKIWAIHFLHRSGAKQSFVPLLSLDAQQPWIQDVLENKGVGTGTCRAGHIPFRRKLQFPLLVGEGGDGKLLKINRQDVRGLSEQEKRAFIKKIMRLTYESR